MKGELILDKLNNLDNRKKELISNFTYLAKNKTKEEMLPLLLAVTNKAKKEGISFTSNETSMIIEALLADMSPEEKMRIDMFLKLINMDKS